jgi:hypothetical protein
MITGVFGSDRSIHGQGSEATVNHYGLAAQNLFDFFEEYGQAQHVCISIDRHFFAVDQSLLCCSWRVVQLAMVCVC